MHLSPITYMGLYTILERVVGASALGTLLILQKRFQSFRKLTILFWSRWTRSLPPWVGEAKTKQSCLENRKLHSSVANTLIHMCCHLRYKFQNCECFPFFWNIFALTFCRSKIPNPASLLLDKLSLSPSLVWFPYTSPVLFTSVGFVAEEEWDGWGQQGGELPRGVSST